jgi:hypothetical protein
MVFGFAVVFDGCQEGKMLLRGRGADTESMAGLQIKSLPKTAFFISFCPMKTPCRAHAVSYAGHLWHEHWSD